MSPRYISRPRAPKKKIHSKDAFELCYLRHKYFRKVKYNPKPEDMRPYEKIACNLAHNTFFRYQNLFHLVGFEAGDIVNIANVHTVSFLGLFSIEKMPEKYKEFISVFKGIQGRTPDKEDVLDKNKANFTLFLKQRMEDVVRICRQKARNISGMPYEEFLCYCGPNKPPKNLKNLLKDHDRFGFKKIDSSVFKSIKKRAGLVHTSIFDFDGNYYIAIPIEKRALRLDDFAGAGMSPHDSIHNTNPEDLLFNLEDIGMWRRREEEFNDKPGDLKANIIRNFISKNKGNLELKEEIKTAKKLLRGLEQPNE